MMKNDFACASPRFSAHSTMPRAIAQSTPLLSKPSESDKFIIGHNKAEVKFAGHKSTAIVNQGKLLTGDQLETLSRADENPYYGELHAILCPMFGDNPEEAGKAMDQIAASLQQLGVNKNHSIFQSYNPTPIVLSSPTGEKITFKLAGEGNYGIAYKLSYKDKTYILKIFRPLSLQSEYEYKTPLHPFETYKERKAENAKQRQEAIKMFKKRRNIAYDEVAKAGFANAHNIKNASRLYTANPAGNWSLMELIDENTDYANREGVTLESLGCRKFDINANTDNDNMVGPIYIDHGGHMDVPDSLKMTDEELKKEMHRHGLKAKSFDQTC